MSNLASISKIRSRYLLLRWVETVLFGISAMAIVAATCIVLNVGLIPTILAAIVGGSAIALWRYYSLALNKIDNLRVSLYLNRFYPELKDSGDLFVKPQEALTTLELIQLTRIDS